MGSIITKGDRLLARVRVRGCKPVAKSFDKVSDARKWVQATEAAMRDGTYCHGSASDSERGQRGSVPRLTLGEALKQYREAVRPP